MSFRDQFRSRRSRPTSTRMSSAEVSTFSVLFKRGPAGTPPASAQDGVVRWERRGKMPGSAKDGGPSAELLAVAAAPRAGLGASRRLLGALLPLATHLRQPFDQLSCHGWCRRVRPRCVAEQPQSRQRLALHPQRAKGADQLLGPRRDLGGVAALEIEDRDLEPDQGGVVEIANRLELAPRLI